MRKLLLLICALLTGVSGAWAQTPVTSITSGKTYYFFNSCFDQFINSSLQTDRTLANAIKFTLTGSDGNYNIYSADKSGYLTWGTLNNGVAPTISAATSDNTLWTINVQSGIIMNIYPKGQEGKELISQSTTAGKAIALWDFGNQGGQWYIYEAEEFEEVIAAKNSISNGNMYRIYTYNNGTDEGATKYYLNSTGYLTNSQTDAGIFTFTATTSKGAVPKGLAWFVKNSSGKAFTNPEQATRDNHIHQSNENNRQDWDTQVFYLKDGKYAIRATNAGTTDNTWHPSVYWTVDADDNSSGLPDADYTSSPNDKQYIWGIEEATITVTYNVKMGGVTVATATSKQLPGTSASLPTSLQNNYVTIGDPDISTVSDVNNVVNYTATLKEGFPFTYSTDYANAKWYYWKLNGNYVSYAASTPYPASTTKPTTDAGLWAFIGTPYGTKIINKEAGSTKYLQDNSWAELTTTATDWVVANNTNKTIDFFTVHAGTYKYLNLQNSALKYWNDTRGATDNGSTFTVEEYTEDFAADVATYITPYFNTHGSYFSIKDDVYSANSATWEAAKSTCTKATYDELFALVSNEDNIVWPATGLYLLKNHNSSQYLTATTTNLAMSSTSNVPSAIVRLTKNDDGTYYIQLQGLYVKTPTSSGTCSLGSTPVKFTPAIGTATKVSLTAAGGATSGYENITAHGGNAVGFPARGIDTDPYSYWSVEDATSIEVTLNNGGDGFYYATCFADFPVSYTGASNGEGLFVLTGGENNNKVTAQKVDAVPAQQGFLIRLAAENVTESKVTLTIPASADALTGHNVLRGTCLATSKPDGNVYVFSKVGDDLGFFPYTGTDNIPANRAYIVEPAGSGTRSFILSFDETTGLNGVSTSTPAGTIFDMQGRRVQTPARGLYIVNGKKVLF